MIDTTVDTMALPLCARGVATCMAQKLNVRDLPSVNGGTVLGQLDQGQKVTVWAVDAGWMIIQAEDGLTGWASASYLRAGELIR